MPTATIQVAAVTSPDQWNLAAGTNKVMAVNSPDNDWTTCIESHTNGHSEQYSLAAHSIPAGSTINSISVYTRCRAEGGAQQVNLIERLHLGGNSSSSPTNIYTASWTSFTDSISRPGGGSWTLSDIASLEVSIYRVSGSGPAYCTSLWIIVDYTLPKPSGMFLLFP